MTMRSTGGLEEQNQTYTARHSHLWLQELILVKQQGAICAAHLQDETKLTSTAHNEDTSPAPLKGHGNSTSVHRW